MCCSISRMSFGQKPVRRKAFGRQAQYCKILVNCPPTDGDIELAKCLSVKCSSTASHGADKKLNKMEKFEKKQFFEKNCWNKKEESLSFHLEEKGRLGI